jgi:hypothetical protein
MKFPNQTFIHILFASACYTFYQFQLLAVLRTQNEVSWVKGIMALKATIIPPLVPFPSAHLANVNQSYLLVTK